jgi:hypothetical protein
MGRRTSSLTKATKGEAMPTHELSPGDRAEIHEVATEIMTAVVTITDPEAVQAEIEKILIRRIEDDLSLMAAEEIHEFKGQRHSIYRCQKEFCGRYAGQRREAPYSGTYDPASHPEDLCKIGGCVGCESPAYRATKAPARCPVNAWPYTENNVCILHVGHDGGHIDARGRHFTAAGYYRKA